MRRHGLQGRYAGHGCRWQPLHDGSASSRDGIRGFPAGTEAGGFTSPYPPVMPQDDRGEVRPPSIRRPWRGRPRSSRLSLDDPSRVDFRLLFYPLVTPLRRDDQGLLSDEASGFTSCAACDRHFLPPAAPGWRERRLARRPPRLSCGC